MSSDVDLADVSSQEIEERLAALEEELEDVAMERRMTLGGTGVHLGAAEAERLRGEFERDEARITAKIDALRATLAART